MNIIVPISLGELIDKITILEIKSKKIIDDKKLKNIKKELNDLQGILDNLNLSKEIDLFYNDLYTTNCKIWDLEDIIRELENKTQFDNLFVDTARQIYQYNDKRSIIKKNINVHFGSLITEEKSYHYL